MNSSNLLDVLFHGPNAGYALELYERYQQDPNSVDPATGAFFATWNGQLLAAHQIPGAALTSSMGAEEAPTPSAPAPTPTTTAHGTYDITQTINAARLIRYVRELGHLDAQIDPLGSQPPSDPGLRLDIQGVIEYDLDVLPASIVRGPIAKEVKNAGEGVARLRQIYSSRIAYETDHIAVFEERAWLRECFEDQRFFQNFPPERKRELLERLSEVEIFEQFLHQTFVGQKRFSVEGCDMLVPILDSIIRNAAVDGAREVVLGMAHRGRLNVLAHVLGKPYADILHEFYSMNRDDGAAPAGKGYEGWTGDVKYHLGARRAFKEAGIEQMPITLAPNPSHLEFVNPVVEGRARAAQDQRDQPGQPAHDPHASLAIVIHGDAAFPGQGVVAETLNLSGLFGYNTGGSIHIVVNNQIGFTTLPSDSRSTLYASDLAKGFEIPIVHVNADDVIGCIVVARLAWAYRHQFGKDFLIDLVGYRRWGHNEGDEPNFTQPEMYRQIANHPTVRELWARELEQTGVIQPGDAQGIITRLRDKLRTAQKEAESAPHLPPVKAVPTFQSSETDRQAAFRSPHTALPIPSTAVPAEQLAALNEALLTRPNGFTPNERLERTLQRRRAMFIQEKGIDWGHAEALAFASILADGVPIRLTGQDSERGTFSHRHLVLHDAKTGARHMPLQTLPQAEASFAVYNSPLSENATLGFEYGYSMHAPEVLVLWEAQFGDFANGAQVIIDQFIVSGRAKWEQTPSLVLLLPHGYEGQGPEHSSARLERFLQLCAADNMRVVYPTSAAQIFHLLRRQAASLRHTPRPLIVMTPKSLLRSPHAGCSLSELSEGHFQPVIAPTISETTALAQVKRLVLCSGKVYVDLLNSNLLSQTQQVAVARVEELYPLPINELKTLFASYPALQEVVWLQEEPQNMGAWSYIAPKLQALLGGIMPLRYAGRSESASPAEGSLSLHKPEQLRILRAALEG